MIELKESKTGRKACAAYSIKKGTVLNTFSEPKLLTPNMHTVQISETVHVEPQEDTMFTDHRCCNTNIAFKIDANKPEGSVVATEDIEKGGALCFNYNTTEWDMNSPFVCSSKCCQEKENPNVIRGFKYLSTEEKISLLKTTHVSPVIKKKCLEEELKLLKVLFATKS